MLTKKHRSKLGSVLDLGAGDGRFVPKSNFDRYLGVEIDKTIIPSITLTPKIQYQYGCVFEHEGDNYDTCVGNPPYLRHNELGVKWRSKIKNRFKSELDLEFDERANLFTYFITLALQKTSNNGLIALLIPYEWTHRPSVKPLRNYIEKNKWNVIVYKLNFTVFEDTFTTASITIVDKARNDGLWSYRSVDKSGNIKTLKNLTDTELSPIDYENRGSIWGLRGLSPGTQKVFTLTEQERKQYKLTRKDVRPCVTTFKHIPDHINILNRHSFEKYFINKNQKCWLIRTDKKLTPNLSSYVTNVPVQIRDTWTCNNRDSWYKYRQHPVPQLMVTSTFKSKRPQIVINTIKAVAVGAAMGIHSNKSINVKLLQNKLIASRFYDRILAYENGLKKIAVRQMNAVLNNICQNG